MARFYTDAHFKLFYANVQLMIMGLDSSADEDFNANQKKHVESLVKAERRFKSILQKHTMGPWVYKQFIEFIVNNNILAARPYFRERQKKFSSGISPAISKRKYKRLYKFGINYPFIVFVLGLKKWGKRSPITKAAKEVLRIRNDIITANIPLAVSRAKIFRQKTPEGHLQYMDLIQVACFVGETEIFMSDGTTKAIKDVKVGDLVITHLGNVKPVIRIFKREVDEDIYKIENVNWAGTTSVTSEHPYFVNGKEFKPIKDVEVALRGYHKSSKSFRPYGRNVLSRDYLSLPCNYRVQDSNIALFKDTKFDSNLGWILGFFLAEGNYLKGKRVGKDKHLKGVLFTTHVDETEYHERMNDFAVDNGLDLVQYQGPGQAYRSRINDEAFANWLYPLCGEYCDQKTIHPQLMNLNRDFLEGVLLGFWCGDGAKRPESRNVCRTVSKRLSRQLFIIASRLGLNPRLINFTSPGKKTCYELSFTNTKHDRPRLRTQYKVENEFNLYQFDKVQKEHFKGSVFNLEVDGDNSYIANGVAVHNCEGLCNAVDKFVLPYTPVFRAVIIGRATGDMIDNLNDTMLHFFPSDKRKIYRANKFNRGSEDLNYGAMAHSVNDGIGSNLNTNADEIRNLTMAANHYSLDMPICEVVNGCDEKMTVGDGYTGDESLRPDVAFESAQVNSVLYSSIDSLDLVERKLLALKGVRK